LSFAVFSIIKPNLEVHHSWEDTTALYKGNILHVENILYAVRISLRLEKGRKRKRCMAESLSLTSLLEAWQEEESKWERKKAEGSSV